MARRRETHHARSLRIAKIASLEVNYWRRGGTNPGQLPFSTLADNTARGHVVAGDIAKKQESDVIGKPHHVKRRAAVSARASATKSGARPSKKYWSAGVTERSNALELEANVFTLDDPAAIARSLKRSAEASARRKAPPFQSAMSMLVFYINRAGKGLSEKRRRVLERAKDELRRAFDRS